MSIYLDEASTTKPLSSVVEAIKPYLETYWHNPSSIYSAGSEVKYRVDNVRLKVSKLICADSGEIYFTSGASESNNWVIRGFDDANYQYDSAIITTPIEHKSIINAVSNPALRSSVYFCDVNNDGSIDLESLKNLLDLNHNKKILVSIIMANNEIGTVQDIESISKLVHSYDGILHTDATQSIKHIPINVQKMGIDLLSASAQKFGGLKGTGFLYKSSNVELAPLIYGEQEERLRGGTENVIGIIALGEAIRKINYDNSFMLTILRDNFISQLKGIGCKVNGSLTNRLPNNINVTFSKNINGENLIYLLDLADIYISSGSACNSRSVDISHVLKAIGLSNEEAMRTIRITLPDDIKGDDIDYVVNEIEKAIKLVEIE